ncbi:MAG: hypothetical protein U0T79_09310 [Ferruginibacter sp.]
MSTSKINKDNKDLELKKYRDLVLATLDYYLDYGILAVKTDDFDSTKHYRFLKVQAEEDYKKGRLTKLKQWFYSLTEMQIETVDLKFNKYLLDKTQYDIDIFKSYFERIDKVVAKGKITSDRQFYDILSLVDHLCQAEIPDTSRINILNKLLADYEQKMSRRRSKQTNA